MWNFLKRLFWWKRDSKTKSYYDKIVGKKIKVVKNKKTSSAGDSYVEITFTDNTTCVIVNNYFMAGLGDGLSASYLIINEETTKQLDELSKIVGIEKNRFPIEEKHMDAILEKSIIIEGTEEFKIKYRNKKTKYGKRIK